MQEVTLAILNPVAMIEVAGVKPAERVMDLNNKRVGLYWNRKARGDVALRKVEEVLRQRFAGLSFTWFETFIMEVNASGFRNGRHTRPRNPHSRRPHTSPASPRR